MDCFSALSRGVRSARVLVVPISLMAVITLSSCGDSDRATSTNNNTTNQLVVPDAGNNRVLVYNTPFTTGGSASIVLGQTDLTTNTVGTTASTMNDPSGVAFDSTGNLYTLESYTGSAGNSRVLQFKTPFTTGMSASAVLGAADFVTAGGVYISGLALDKSNNVWVASVENNTVSEYSAPITSGMASTLTLGSGILDEPKGIAFDASGNLWVADFANNRVVEFAAPLSATSTVALMIGQPVGSTSYPANNGGLSASTLSTPTGVAFDASGNLWVADNGNNRVLEYKAPLSSGMAAQVVIGQADFVSNTANQGLAAPSAATLNAPNSASFVNGNLVVGDSANNRTLIYGASFTNGMSATTVLGQSSFIVNSANQGSTPGAGTQSKPYDGGFSLLALTVVAGLAAIWLVWTQRKRRAA